MGLNMNRKTVSVDDGYAPYRWAASQLENLVKLSVKVDTALYFT